MLGPAKKPWGIVRQFADHRCVLLTDGCWIREGSCTERPDLLLTARTFKTRAAASVYLRAFVDGSHTYVSRVTP